MEGIDNTIHNEELVKEVVKDVIEAAVNDSAMKKDEALVINENTKILLGILKMIISENVEVSNIMNKIGIKLGSNEKEILMKILEHSPETFEKIEISMKKIVLDNKIDSKDVPEILFCIQELYQMIYKFKTIKLDTKKRCELCATIIKFVIHILVEERIIKIDEEKKVEFLSSTDILVDSAITLIGLSKIIKPAGCLKKIFNKK